MGVGVLMRSGAGCPFGACIEAQTDWTGPSVAVSTEGGEPLMLVIGVGLKELEVCPFRLE